MHRSAGRARRAAAALIALATSGLATAQDGPCCLPDGQCAETDLYSCAALAGQFLAGAGCDGCATAVGACCTAGGCQLLALTNELACAMVGGAWLGAGTSCIDCLPTPAACGDAAVGCFAESDAPGCNDTTCCTVVCALDAFCCSTSWDETCADAAAVVCGPPPGAADAELLNVVVRRGLLLSGNTDGLIAADDDLVLVRSEVLPQSPPRHLVDVRVVARSPFESVTRIDLTAELSVSAGPVDTRIYLRDFAAGRWRLLDRFDASTSEVERRLLDVDGPQRFVGGDRRVLVRVLMRRSATFVGRLDRVAVTIGP